MWKGANQRKNVELHDFESIGQRMSLEILQMSRSALILTIVCFAAARISAGGQESNVAETADRLIVRLMKETAARLPQIKSFSIVGRAHLTPSEELVRDYSRGKTVYEKDDPTHELNDQTRYLVMSKGVSLKCESQSVNNPSSGIDKYYWDGVNVIWESRVSSGASAAVIAAPEFDAPLLTGISGFLAEYAFLRSDVNRRGTPSWLASDFLQWQRLWEDASNCLIAGSVKRTDEDRITAQFKMPWGTANVTFQVYSGALFPVATKLVDKGDVVIMENHVMAFEKDEKSGLVMATKAVSSVRKPLRDGGTMLMGTVTNNLEKIEINLDIDDNTLAFDPTAVDEIVDRGVAITIPK